MIRAGRFAIDVNGLAQLHGIAVQTLYNQGITKNPRHPAPITSPHARHALWDLEQARAAAQGKPIPELPIHDDPDDLLDRGEAAALLRRPVSPRTWNYYVRRYPYLAQHTEDICGVTHHRRHIIEIWDSNRPGPGVGGGRPTGSREPRPRGENLTRVNEMLTHAEARHERLRPIDVANTLGVHYATAIKLIQRATQQNQTR